MAFSCARISFGRACSWAISSSTLRVLIPTAESSASATGKPTDSFLLRRHAASQRSMITISGTGRTGKPRHSHGCQKITVRQEALSPTAANTAIWRIPGKGASIIIR